MPLRIAYARNPSYVQALEESLLPQWSGNEDLRRALKVWDGTRQSRHTFRWAGEELIEIARRAMMECDLVDKISKHKDACYRVKWDTAGMLEGKPTFSNVVLMGRVHLAVAGVGADPETCEVERLVRMAKRCGTLLVAKDENPENADRGGPVGQYRIRDFHLR